MNLHKVKQIEDLKNERDDLSRTAKGIIRANKRVLLDQASVDFKKFFEQRGFVVTTESNVSNATYNKFIVWIVNVLETDENWPINIRLSEGYSNINNYVIGLIKDGDSKIGPRQILGQLDDNQKIDQEITRLDKEVEDLKQQIDQSSPKPVYFFEISSATDQRGTPVMLMEDLRKKKFKDFTEVLTAMFE